MFTNLATTRGSARHFRDQSLEIQGPHNGRVRASPYHSRISDQNNITPHTVSPTPRPHHIHSPAELGQLTEIDGHFNLGYNMFNSQAIPTELGMLSEIGNDFRLPSWSDGSSSNLPSELGNLVKLTYGLDMSGCELIGTIPTEIGRMSEMTSIFLLKSNSISSSIPTQLGQMSELTRYFDLQSNKVHPPHPPRPPHALHHLSPLTHRSRSPSTH